MKKETKEYLIKNTAVVIFSLLIIIAILVSQFSGIPFEEFKLAIMLLAFFIISQVFTQALQYEPEKTRKKIQKIILVLVVILFLLTIYGVVVFFGV